MEVIGIVVIVVVVVLVITATSKSSTNKPPSVSDNAAVRRNQTKTESPADSLAQENRALRHELMRRDISDICDKIQAEFDDLLEDKESMNSYKPVYHAWHILGDISYQLSWNSEDADYEKCEAILYVMTHLQRNRQEIIEQVVKDPRWKLFENRNLGFGDLQQMRGLAHVAMNEKIDILTKGVFSSLQLGD